MNTITALRSYQRFGELSDIEHASPYRLVQIVIGRAIAEINQAQGGAGNGIHKAVGLIEALQTALPDDPDPESVVGHLDALYRYMIDRLLERGAQPDQQTLRLVAELLTHIQAAWDSVAQKAHTDPDLAHQLADSLAASQP